MLRECVASFFAELLSCFSVLISYNEGETYSCQWLQPRSIQGPVPVVFMSRKINFHIINPL